LPHRAGERGFILIALIALLAMGGLYFLVSNLTPEALEARRQAKTDAALIQARDALIGYALQYREQQNATGGTNNAMYGFLPMPDVGTSKFNIGQQNPSCNTEGCAMSFMNGAFPAKTDTIVGRLPWRTLGIEPLRDGHGECLWYIVSAHHKSLGIDTTQLMNWDALGQIDVVTTNDTEKLQSLFASPHDRPIAIIFSPGPLLGSQIRGPIDSDVVTECGGNYNPANYLEPSLAAALLDNSGNASSASAYFSGATATDTSSTALAISTQGKIFKDGTALKKTCPVGSANCTLATNDIGLLITSDSLFSSIRKNSAFRTEIKSMLDLMVGCLRDRIAGGIGFSPSSITGFTPSNKSAGHFPTLTNTCYDYNKSPVETYSCFTVSGSNMSGTGRGSDVTSDCISDRTNPPGYFSNYSDQIFVANGNTFNVSSDPTCSGVLLFANQRNPTQRRITSGDKNTLSNYLEGINLTSFTGTGTIFNGDIQLSAYPGQAIDKDIVRCIPASASFTNSASGNQVVSSVLASLGLSQLADYNAATRTLTLGALGVSTTQVGAANAKALFGCSWTPASHSMGSGLRSYFKFNIANTGEGFTFAIIDGDRNGSNVCGAAQQHLGYSGNNTFTPFIAYPKIGIEVDTTETTAQKNAFNPAAANTLTNGRSDPNYTGGHVAIVYWGGESPYATGNVVSACTAPKYWNAGACYLPQEEDDNVHGLPTPPDASLRASPRNPPAPATPVAAPAGVYKLDPSLSSIPANKDIHVRVELTKRTPTSLTSVRVALQTAIDLSNPGASLDGIAMNNGDRVLVTAQSTSADNGIYTWNGATSAMTRTTDASTATTLQGATTQVAAGTYAGTTWRQTAIITTLGNDAVNWIQYAINNYSVRVATRTNIVLSGPGTTLDGIGMNNGDRVLVTAQSTSADNGIYSWNGAASPMTRTADANTATAMLEATANVIAGTNAGTTWRQTAAVNTLGTDNISWSQYVNHYLIEAWILADSATVANQIAAMQDTSRPMSQLYPGFTSHLRDLPFIYDIQGGACPCSTSQVCGSDNMCYTTAFQTVRLGFTNSQSTAAKDQIINITNFTTTWLP
jgi:hypothetical protein